MNAFVLFENRQFIYMNHSHWDGEICVWNSAKRSNWWERERKRVKCEQPQIFKLKAWKHCAIACFFSFNFNTIIAISGYLCAHLCIVVTVTFILIYIFEKEWKKKNEKKISINYWFVWSCWITVYESSSVHSLTFDFIGLQCIKCV